MPPKPPPINAFTVDVEDWYQGLEMAPEQWDGFEDRLHVGLLRLLDLLRETGVQATFFVLGHVAQQHPDLVRRIHDEGHEIGTHGYSHQFVYKLGREGFYADLQRSLEALDRIVDVSIQGHRAPFFSITRQAEWAFDVLVECGLSYDSSVFPVRNYRYGIPDAPRWIYQIRPGLSEIPPSTYRLGKRNIPLGGGAYFRLFPYTLTKYGLARINAEGQAAVFYIHPWELDPDHPRLDLPRRIGLTHYWNLKSTEARLRRLLKDFSFSTMSHVLSLETSKGSRG
ncbi:MAG: DUF3473 domain-containing protein [Candidatus Latescibacteria bacterium]|nr:DUF3473 domain-containing protein [Candidatus Latescibacterota bacterium]